MTDADFRELKEFANLPLYDEDDPRCSSIDDLPDEPDYNCVLEAGEIILAHEYRHRSNTEAKGAIRHWNGDRTESSIFVYFWERRSRS